MNNSDERLTNKDKFDRDGYLVVRDFLPPVDLARLTTELDRYVAEVVPTLSPGDAFFHDRSDPSTLKQIQHMGTDSFFEEYRNEPRWNQLAREVVGEECVAREPEWFNKPPMVDHPTPPHQDNYYFCQNPPNVVTCWLALDKVDQENGGLRYVRGSHAVGIRPHLPTSVLGFSQGISDYGPDDEAREVCVDLDPGDLVVHHGNTIHRALPNQSRNRNRRAFAMVFYGVSCKRDESAYSVYLDSLKEQHERMVLTTGNLTDAKGENQ